MGQLTATAICGNHRRAGLFMVLSGAVLRSFMGVNGLVRRMALDRCLPQFLLKTSRRGTTHRIFIAISIYLRQLELLYFDPAWDVYFSTASKFFLFASGISGCLVILFFVMRAYHQRRQIHKTLQVDRVPAAT